MRDFKNWVTLAAGAIVISSLVKDVVIMILLLLAWAMFSAWLCSD